MYFKYKAIKNGVTIEREIEAATAAAAIDYLKKNGYFPIKVEEAKKQEATIFSSLFDKISFNDIVDFTRQISGQFAQPLYFPGQVRRSVGQAWRNSFTARRQFRKRKGVKRSIEGRLNLPFDRRIGDDCRDVYHGHVCHSKITRAL